MEKGYLLILVGAIFSTTLRIPMPLGLASFWSRLVFWGFLFISFGMRQIQGTEKELKYAQFFTFLSLIIRLGLPWISQLLPPMLVLITMLVFIFCPLAIFFWLFKSEYLWSPSSTKRLDWYIYSAIAFIYLLLNIAVILPMIAMRLPLATLGQTLQFVNLLYNIVLIGLLLKLYLAAKNDTGAARWN